MLLLPESATLVSVTVAGLNDTATGGFNVMPAVAVLLASATLVAVSVTLCMLVIMGGAVYQPAALTEPTLGLTLHRTAV